MLTKDAKIAVVGAGAIGGITAAFLKKAGWDPILDGKKTMSLSNLAELTG